MRAAPHRALPSLSALRLAGAAALVTTLAAQLLGATTLAASARLSVLVLMLAGAASLLPTARATASVLGGPRVRVRPDSPDGSRLIRLGLRRKPARAAAEVGWRPSPWTPADVVPWSPDVDRPRG